MPKGQNRDSLIVFNLEQGDMVPQSGGIRKARWKRQGTGKSGGVRVIYYTRNKSEELVLPTLYAKSTTEDWFVSKPVRRLAWRIGAYAAGLGARPQAGEWCCAHFVGHRSH